MKSNGDTKMKNIQECSYALFLLSNCAFGEELALKANDYGTDLTPISRAMKRIGTEIFNFELPNLYNLGTYNFMRKQTQSSKLFKQLDPYLKCYYIRKDRTRVVYIDFAYDDKMSISRFLKIIAIWSGIELDDFRARYKTYLIKHMVSNELLPHEQLMFFDRFNYREFLRPQFELAMNS